MITIKNDIPQEPITKEFIRQFLPDNPIIIEAGAHIGRDTLKMSTFWPDAHIYAFEPVPELFAQLKERTGMQPDVHTFNLALSDTQGTATLHVSSGASTAASSLLEPYEYVKERPNVLFHPITVPTTTLDAWAAGAGLNHIDFLWLDMQGYELKVLKASPTILATVRAILIEASLTERFKENPLYGEIRTWLEDQGFTAIKQDIPKHHKINILFVRK